MVKTGIVSMLRCFYRLHTQGHPLAGNDTVADADSGAVTYVTKDFAFGNEVEAILLKATVTLKPTRLYGLHGYDLLELVATSEDMMNLVHGFFSLFVREDESDDDASKEVDGNKKKTKAHVSKPKKPEACAHCGNVDGNGKENGINAKD